jgi:hypothetical protein
VASLLAALLTVAIAIQAWTIKQVSKVEEYAVTRAEVAVVADREMVRVVGVLAERVAALEGESESWLPDIRDRLDRVERRLDELAARDVR